VIDREADAAPMGIAPTDAGSSYQVRTSLPDSRGAALVLTGILKVQPANPVAVLIQPAAGRW